MIVVIYLLSEKNIHNFKSEKKKLIFPIQFLLGSISQKLLGLEKYHLKEMFMVFPVDCGANNKSDILNISLQNGNFCWIIKS